MSGDNNFNVGYGSICFMEQVLTTHTAVASFERQNDIQFLVERRSDLTDLNVVFVDEYELGEAFAYAVINEFDGVNVIVNNGNWNHIILDWRDFAKRTDVAILKVSDFMGAINVNKLEKYVTESEREERRRKRKKSS